jgi:shikimate kinase
MKCIILIGNLAAGKSTVAKALGLPSVVIDNYRRIADNEYQARELMVKDIHTYAQKRQNFIYETTGANLVHNKAMKVIKTLGFDEVRVLLHVSQSESLRRCTERGTAAPFGKTHSDSYLYINERFNREWGHVFIDTEKIAVNEIVDKISQKLYDSETNK